MAHVVCYGSTAGARLKLTQLHAESAIDSSGIHQYTVNQSGHYSSSGLSIDEEMSDLNDPRVLFAAERTLLAWHRTSLTLMAFGFVIERFGLFLHLVSPEDSDLLQRGVSHWVGIAFIGLGALASVMAIIQYRKVLQTLKPVEIPAGYALNLGVIANLAIAVLGVALIIYLFRGQIM